MAQSIEFDGKVHQFPDDFTEADIQAALSSTPAPRGQIEDVFKSAGTGLVKGAIGIVGMKGDAARLLESGINYGADYLRNKGALDIPPEATKAFVNTMTAGGLTTPGSQDITKAVETVAGPLAKPETRLGRYSEQIGEFAPSALLPGGMISKAANVVLPAVAGEFASEQVKGTKYEPYEPYIRTAASIGAGFVPGLAQRAVTPLPIPRERQAMVDTLRAHGVDAITPGQTSGNTKLKYFEAQRGGQVAENLIERQGEQFTAAALRTAGVQAQRATPDVIDAAFTRLGNTFDDLAARNAITADRLLARDLRNASHNYNAVVPEAMRSPIIDNTVRDVANAINRGPLSGDAYSSLRSRLEKVARGSSDNQLSAALRDIRGALDDAMERTIRRSNPGDLGAWRDVRNQYRNMLAVERAATGAGENAALGLISPSALRNAVVQIHGRRNYARGQGDLADLARAGEALLKPLPNSGTAPRLLAALGGQSTMAGVVGSVLGSGGGPVGTAIGGAIGAALPAVVNRARMSAPVRAYMQNQIFAGAQNENPVIRSGLLGLLSANGAR